MTDTNGQESNNSQGEGESPKYITAEELNKAITARFGAFEKKNKEAILEALNSIVPEIDKRVASLMTPEAKGKVEEDPKYKGLEKEIRELRQRAESEATARAAAEGKAKDRELRQTLRDQLATIGVDGDRARHAVGFLVDAERRVAWNEDGDALVYKDPDGSEVDLKSGLRAWAKSDESKIYLPPRGTTGSGERQGGTKQNGAAKVSREEIGQALLKTMFSG